MVMFWTITRELQNSIKFIMQSNLKIVVIVKCVKLSQNQVVYRTNGHLLQHSIEYCIVAVPIQNNVIHFNIPNVVFFHNDGIQNAKPRCFYGMINKLFPDKWNLELFGRPNNMFPNWVTVGNEM